MPGLPIHYFANQLSIKRDVTGEVAGHPIKAAVEDGMQFSAMFYASDKCRMVFVCGAPHLAARCQVPLICLGRVTSHAEPDDQVP